jgi:type IV secretion system protein VirB9
MKNWIWALGLILGTAATAFGDEIPPREDIVLKEHVVGSGETVAQIFRNHGLTDVQIFREYVELFREHNKQIPDVDLIKEGDVVVVPLPKDGDEIQPAAGEVKDFYVQPDQEPLTQDKEVTNKLVVSRELPDQDLEDLPILPPVEYISPKPVKLSSKEQKGVTLAQEWKERTVNPLPGAAGQVMFVFGATMPTLVCAPLQPTDLELQSGELVNDIFLGDTARWVVSVGSSGSTGQERTHLVFKPFDAGQETSAVITTDRRTYHIKLVSDPKKHIPYAGFTYPEDEHAKLAKQLADQKRESRWQSAGPQLAEATGKEVRLSDLDFTYQITGDDVPWRPEQVFNDGGSTIIRLPDAVQQTDMPVLLVEQSGEKTLVNYRTRGTTMIVDGVFSKGLLLSGVGRKQKKVIIQRMVKS